MSLATFISLRPGARTPGLPAALALLGAMSAMATPVTAQETSGQESVAQDSVVQDTMVQEAALQEDMGIPERFLLPFVEGETERSRMCVAPLNRQEDLTSALEPLDVRAGRLAALAASVALEDSLRVAPFREDDPLEAAVQSWFQEDAALAEAYLESEDPDLVEARDSRRNGIREQLQEAFDALNEQADLLAAERIPDPEAHAQALAGCDGAVLVRSAVLEVCQDEEGAVCEAARASAEAAQAGRYRFVDDARVLWDMEEIRPWTEPLRIQPSPDGGLAGARTSSMVRRGNVVLALSVEPLLQNQEDLEPESVAEFQANLEALGFDFQHPELVMAPSVALRLSVQQPIMGETHYLLHFDDLSNPAEQVFWSTPVGSGGPYTALIPAPGWVLSRLAGGDPVALTAVILPPDDPESDEVIEAEAVYTLEVTPVGQVQSIGNLLAYLGGGELAADLVLLLGGVDETDPSD